MWAYILYLILCVSIEGITARRGRPKLRNQHLYKVGEEYEFTYNYDGTKDVEMKISINNHDVYTDWLAQPLIKYTMRLYDFDDNTTLTVGVNGGELLKTNTIQVDQAQERTYEPAEEYEHYIKTDETIEFTCEKESSISWAQMAWVRIDVRGRVVDSGHNIDSIRKQFKVVDSTEFIGGAVLCLQYAQHRQGQEDHYKRDLLKVMKFPHYRGVITEKMGEKDIVQHNKPLKAGNSKGLQNKDQNMRDCWVTLNAKDHFNTMEELESKYSDIRREFDEQQFFDKFDEELLGTLLAERGATNRVTQKHANQRNLIPSGMNLGGYSMMRMPNSILFFHRMKLRNDTRFRVNYLSSNFTEMTMMARLSLNDLHLVGNYEMAQTQADDPSALIYMLNYGEIQILLRDVMYKMEGRYRLQNDKMFLEMILSEFYIPYDGILISCKGANASDPEEYQNLEPNNIADFLDRLKTDLDLWLKDFFNEFLLEHTLSTISTQDAFLQYDKERVVNLNRYVDSSLEFLTERLEKFHDKSVKLPNFSIYTFNGMILQLKDGTLTGLDTMYRRSMATNRLEIDVRKVDALIAFSSLKASYSYEVKLTTGSPPLFGNLILSGDELSAIMSLSMVKEPVFVDLKFSFIQQLKPESLTVEGSVGRVISNFKHILELHIIAIMSNAMVDQVKQLRSLVKCEPTLIAGDNDNRNFGNLTFLRKNKRRQRPKKFLKSKRSKNVIY